ncbi:alpha-1,4-glucan--maltose-1-phosphate maltosyltransferase [PVC group bacterium]|nr:alpha-1,4-glucan--maltose-1-phosphate maltosyltransferase [PVC group bacterium]
MVYEGHKRVIIEHLRPQIDGGEFPIKRVLGERVRVEADVFADGHEQLAVLLMWRPMSAKTWKTKPMRPLANDVWSASFVCEGLEPYEYTVRGWMDHYETWRLNLIKKMDVGQDISVDLRIGAAFLKKGVKQAKGNKKKILESIFKKFNMLKNDKAIRLFIQNEKYNQSIRESITPSFITEYNKKLQVKVHRTRALFSSWYELFPRSTKENSLQHGTFKDCEKILPDIAAMGFDVVYFPPIHPIGVTNRKGKNNVLGAASGDPGSPWAIGSAEGGHKSVHPELGTIKDFRRLVKKTKSLGMEIALDLAFQCSPDHPYENEHPEWFKWRPDGTVQYAENPPKKYEDIIPFNFETRDQKNLWKELKSIVDFWIEKGVRIFRVDNPHTKPYVFWQWLLGEVEKSHPDVIFLAEAFTRPKIMRHLAKLGFHQSYTYFTWRTTKKEFIKYLTELTKTEAKEYFRPNFWPNTPDILSIYLQNADRAAFVIRLVLAATMSSNYGIYGPAYELCENQPTPGKEEYADNEKYEIKDWRLGAADSMRPFITQLNHIRRKYDAFQTTRNIRFHRSESEHILCYSKMSRDTAEIFIVVVNLDPQGTQSGWVDIPVLDWGFDKDRPYQVEDVLTEVKTTWTNERNIVKLDPRKCPAQIFRLEKIS